MSHCACGEKTSSVDCSYEKLFSTTWLLAECVYTDNSSPILLGVPLYCVCEIFILFLVSRFNDSKSQ